MHPPEGARRRGWAGRAGGAPRAPVCLHLTVPRDHTKMVADVETGTRPSSYGHGRDAERCVEDYWQLAPPPAWRRDVSGMTPRVEKLPSLLRSGRGQLLSCTEQFRSPGSLSPGLRP
ncbi:uncharacterized protein LOC116562075 isoform X2 [Sapajus apella]|uniref:Uncharacterized protein LOC116562075 isoform X2 n=1 Tax=Sapajus apella TaxID=9515 RepID=A0A6J3J7K3_SAPAP|nr:uncharacterized protein LOC116562075 isoform X2 [Sapajus apella]